MAQKSAPQSEYDSVYFLKVLIYLLLGTVWLAPGGQRLVPIGLILGLLVVQHDKLQIDRKIEYAILLVGTILGLAGIGITFFI
jgi:hypothetical protein